MAKSEGRGLGYGPPCDIIFQGQISRAAANNRVCGHASGCGCATASPTTNVTPEVEDIGHSMCMSTLAIQVIVIVIVIFILQQREIYTNIISK